MKVLAINGSPHEKGCTYEALQIVSNELKTCAIDCDIVHIGTDPIRGCIACMACAKMAPGTQKCAFDDDIVNALIERSRTVDGLILGTPVHFSGIAGSMKCVLDRFFYAGSKDRIGYLPAGAVVSVRRTGGSTTLDQLLHYLTYSNMPIASSRYWTVVHGSAPEDVSKDLEGVQTLRHMAKNLAWLINSLKDYKEYMPEMEPRISTNFIR